MYRIGTSEDLNVPISYCINGHGNDVRVHLAGVVTNTEVIDFEVDIIQDPNIVSGFNMLIDGSQVIHIEIQTPIISCLLEIERVFPEKFMQARRAFVFNSPRHDAWARQLIAHTPGVGQIFFDLNTAVAWLYD